MIKMSILLIIALAPLFGAIVAGLFGKQVGRTGAHAVTIVIINQVAWEIACREFVV